jgi:hypothetical protein
MFGIPIAECLISTVAPFAVSSDPPKRKRNTKEKADTKEYDGTKWNVIHVETRDRDCSYVPLNNVLNLSDTCYTDELQMDCTLTAEEAELRDIALEAESIAPSASPETTESVSSGGGTRESHRRRSAFATIEFRAC